MPVTVRARPFSAAALPKRCCVSRQVPIRAQQQRTVQPSNLASVPAAALLWLAGAAPALAESDFSQGGFAPESYWTALGLFAISLPGLWSLIKRAPKAKIKRKTFETAGPAVEGAMSLDDRARQLYQYFKKYNYEVKSTGEVITFVGTYAASRGQAAAITFYTFVGLGSTGLVLSIAAPGGNFWYGLTLLSPLAGYYYWINGTRQEEFKMKMVTSDDEKTTDIVVEGDDEEIERMVKELQLREKGKVYVKGVLE